MAERNNPLTMTAKHNQTMSTRNIGGSILPSSSPQILAPMKFGAGVLQVVQDFEADTHHLTLQGKVIASHPNGYSCHELGKRMLAGDRVRVIAQAAYIVDCGGKSDLSAIEYAMAETTAL